MRLVNALSVDNIFKFARTHFICTVKWFELISDTDNSIHY